MFASDYLICINAAFLQFILLISVNESGGETMHSICGAVTATKDTFSKAETISCDRPKSSLLQSCILSINT